jgi:hypothetical protein
MLLMLIRWFAPDQIKNLDTGSSVTGGPYYKLANVAYWPTPVLCLTGNQAW